MSHFNRKKTRLNYKYIKLKMFAVIIPYSTEFIHIPVFTKRFEFLMIFYNILITIALPIDSDVKFKVQFIGN